MKFQISFNEKKTKGKIWKKLKKHPRWYEIDTEFAIVMEIDILKGNFFLLLSSEIGNYVFLTFLSWFLI